MNKTNRFAAFMDEEPKAKAAPVAAPVAKVEEPKKKEVVRRDGNQKRTNQRAGPRRGRQFDRQSGTGRGKEMKKGGAGKHNWGDDKKEETPVKTEEETAVEEPKEEEAPKEPEAKHLSYEEFQKQQAEKRSGDLFAKKEAKVDTSALEGLTMATKNVLLEVEEEEEEFVATKKSKKIDLSAKMFGAVRSNNRRDNRDNRDNRRGGDRKGRTDRKPRANKPKVDDFPAL
eukprot:TRINITY_DN779953_c0_g1_i1.p1 TRINITY_DN779953_c0_g1~~TRINITY_DN779953_c0_g1_i1.p1  ORF type:complete len:240 (-),score=76.77 TRINITY_DN779953_c0_g1_i1:90-773(-)